MKNETKKGKISVEEIVAVIFIVMIFSSFVFTVMQSHSKIKEEIKAIWDNKEKTKYEKIAELTEKSETILNDNIYMKSTYVDIYGLVQRVIQKRYIEDSNDRTRDVIKLKNNMLTFIQKKEDMETRANNISNLNQILKEENIPFIYVQAPYKVKSNEDLPIGVIDYANENADVLLENLKKDGVKVVDLREYFADIKTEKEYFITDHHWKVEIAFKAVNHITNLLNEDYGFNIDIFFEDINNYKKIKQEKNYLGSIGKRIGKYYAGVDDFEYILPNYETKLNVNKGDGEIEGTFEETIIVKDLLDEKDIMKNKYACYFGGDFPEIIIQNEKSLSDKKVLVVQDSYGLPFSAFMSLRIKELRMIDLRHFEGNEIDYMREYNPDVVIMMYNPSSFYIEKNFEFK